MKRNILKGLLMVAATAMLLSCTGTDGTGPSTAASAASAASVKETKALVSNLLPHLAVCSVQPYRTTTQLIGVSGGTLKIGKNKFDVPSHALLVPVRITMEVFGDSTRSVRFSPEGLIFNPTRLPKLELDTKGCDLPKGGKNKIAHTSELLRILELLPSITDPLNGTVSADLKHFSRYAVAW